VDFRILGVEAARIVFVGELKLPPEPDLEKNKFHLKKREKMKN
jgi:hypothetical protein